MTRADTEQIKVHYKGAEDDFIVMAESVDAVKAWRKDSSKPLIDVVNSFDVFVTGKQGAQGQLNRASKSALENEFGSSKDDDVVKKILEKGDVQEVKVSPQRTTNLSNDESNGN
jgi:ribosome maturation protein Sdo1